MNKTTEFRLTHELARKTTISHIERLNIDSEHPFRIIIDTDNRTHAQNRKMWAVLSDIAKQVEWCNEYLTSEEWKHLITANLKGQKCVKGISGGIVFTGLPTRRMNKKEFSDVVICAEQFGAENGVIFSDAALSAIELAEQYKFEIEKLNSRGE